MLKKKYNQQSRQNYLIPYRFPRKKYTSTQIIDHVDLLDIWLPRLSHFSQFGLFIITLGSLYFVVLPIYQKSILDEAIARKEIELKESERLVEQNYVLVRNYLLIQYISTAFRKCINTPQNSEVGFRPYFSLKNNASNCLIEQVESSSNIKVLRAEDQIIFSVALKNIADEIEQSRIIALKNFNELPNKAKQNPSLLKPPKYFMLQGIDILEKLEKNLGIYSETRSAKERFKAGLTSALMDIESEYLTLANQKLNSLKYLKWDNSKSIQIQ